MWPVESVAVSRISKLSESGLIASNTRWSIDKPNVSEACTGIGRYFDFCNRRRPGASLNEPTPDKANFIPAHKSAWQHFLSKGSIYRRGIFVVNAAGDQFADRKQQARLGRSFDRGIIEAKLELT